MVSVDVFITEIALICWLALKLAYELFTLSFVISWLKPNLSCVFNLKLKSLFYIELYKADESSILYILERRLGGMIKTSALVDTDRDSEIIF